MALIMGLFLRRTEGRPRADRRRVGPPQALLGPVESLLKGHHETDWGVPDRAKPSKTFTRSENERLEMSFSLFPGFARLSLGQIKVSHLMKSCETERWAEEEEIRGSQFCSGSAKCGRTI